MQVTLKYNKNTRQVTLSDSDECCEYRFTVIDDTDDELSVIVMQDYNPDMLEEPIHFKAQIFDEIIDTE